VNSLPDGPLGKVLALAIAALLLLAIRVTVIGPLLTLYDGGQQKLQEQLDLVERLKRSAADLPRLRAAVQQWREQAHGDELLLAGSSDTVAAAALQTTLKTLVEQGGAKLSSAEILPPDTVDRFRKVGIRVSFTGELSLLTSVLGGIETAHPIMFLDNLDIRTASKASGDDADQTLTIALDVYGLRSL
jgi:general secretion pathway protein M